MKINRLQISGYQTLGEIDWTLPDKGLWLINGINKDSQTCKSNGAGKSALLDTVYYCAYDASAKKADVKNMVNWKYADEGKGMFVKAHIDNGNGALYEFIRSRSHADYGTGFQIHSDDADLSTHIKKDMGTVFDSIVTQSAREYRANTYIGYGMSNRFTSLTDSQKKSVIEQALQINSTVQYEKAVNTLHAQLNQEIIALEQIQASLLAEFETTQETIRQLTSKQLEWIQDKDEHVKIANENIRVSGENLAKIELAIKNIELTTLPMVLTSSKQFAVAVQAQFKSVSEDQTTAATKASSVTHKERELTAAERLLEQGICPACGSEIKDGHFDIIGEKSQLLKLQGEQATADKQAQLAEQIYNDTLKRSQELNTEVQKLQDRLRELREELRATIALREGQSKYIEQISVDPYAALLSNSRSTLTTTEDSQSVNAIELKTKRDKLAYYKLAGKVFNDHGVRILLLEQGIKLVNHYLDQLCSEIGEGDIIAQLDFKGRKTQKINVVVPNRRGGYELLSDGEKRFVDILIQLAFYMVAQKQDAPFLILDEVFQLVDNERLEHIFNYLEKIALTTPIFVVTHNTFAQAIIQNQLTVVLENGISTLQMS